MNNSQLPSFSLGFLAGFAYCWLELQASALVGITALYQPL